jgi:hypothetical protein
MKNTNTDTVKWMNVKLSDFIGKRVAYIMNEFEINLADLTRFLLDTPMSLHQVYDIAKRHNEIIATDPTIIKKVNYDFLCENGLERLIK